MTKYNIAVILTCFNRREKTLSCLNGLYLAQEKYNDADIALGVYLTDDGCSDGTAQAVKNRFSDKDITILQGDGNLFWAGGMRLAWNAALKEDRKWDFFLLLNDDTTPMENMFHELFNAHSFSLKEKGVPGVYSGVTTDIADKTIITYGGAVWVNKFLGTDRRVLPNGIPQEVDKTNANILFVAGEVVDKIGIFYSGYHHGAADYDYSIQAKKAGFSALITAAPCGVCERDHRNWGDERKKILNMSYSQRKAYFANPRHSSHDVLIFKKRNTPLRYPLVWIGRFLNEKCPHIYYLMDIIRGE